MKQKYTIVLSSELHDWFAHRAIDDKTSISSLIMDAMEAYKSSRTPKVAARDLMSSPGDALHRAEKIPEAEERRNKRSIYNPGTKTLNGSPEARKVSKFARKTIKLLSEAKKAGVPTQELHKILQDAGADFQTRRYTLSYLRDNEMAKRTRDGWVHADFVLSPASPPRTRVADHLMQG